MLRRDKSPSNGTLWLLYTLTQTLIVAYNLTPSIHLHNINRYNGCQTSQAGPGWTAAWLHVGFCEAIQQADGHLTLPPIV